MNDDEWARLAEPFVDDAYATVKGRVRTHVLHAHLMDHLTPPPAPILDIGGGAGHQAFPLAREGYEVTILDPSPTMLDRARQRLADEPAEVRDRISLIQARGQDAAQATGAQRFAAVLCHGVLMYLDDPDPLIAALSACAADGAVVSVMALNAQTMAIRPGLQRRWADALSAFDARGERGVLGVDTRADTVEDLSGTLRSHGIQPVTWYGVWLFCDWMNVDDDDPADVAAVELQASRRDPYRQLSRVFHLIGRNSSE